MVQLGNVWTYKAARARLAWAESSEMLRAELPTANDGTTTPAAAERCLDELARFQVEARWICIQLVDDEIGAVLRTYEWSNEVILSADELYLPPYLPDGDGGMRALTEGEADRWAVWVKSPLGEVVDVRMAMERFPEVNPRWMLGDCPLVFLQPGGPNLELVRPLSLVPVLRDWTVHEFTINALIAVLTAAVEDGLPVEWQ